MCGGSLAVLQIPYVARSVHSVCQAPWAQDPQKNWELVRHSWALTNSIMPFICAGQESPLWKIVERCCRGSNSNSLLTQLWKGQATLKQHVKASISCKLNLDSGVVDFYKRRPLIVPCVSRRQYVCVAPCYLCLWANFSLHSLWSTNHSSACTEHDKSLIAFKNVSRNN